MGDVGKDKGIHHRKDAGINGDIVINWHKCPRMPLWWDVPKGFGNITSFNSLEEREPIVGEKGALLSGEFGHGVGNVGCLHHSLPRNQ